MAAQDPSAGSGKRRRGLTAHLLRAALTIGIVIAIELAARALNLPGGFFLLPRGGNCLRRTPSLSVEFRPDCIGELSETHFATNRLGFRGPEPREDGAVRILAIGDSCTWGWRVGQDESYQAVLQRLLDEQYGAGRYEVFNAGVPGYTSYQVLGALREKGLALHPAIVIIGAGFNDGTYSGDVEERIAAENRLMPLLRLDDLLIDHSRLYRWARWKGGGDLEPHGALRVPPDRYGRNLRAMLDLVQAQHAQAMLLSFWSPSPFAPEDVYQQYRLELQQAAESKGVPLLQYDRPRLDLVHPTADGDRGLAGDILLTLQAMRWVPVDRSS